MLGASRTVIGSLAPYADHIRPEVEVRFREAGCHASTNSACEPKDNGGGSGTGRS